MMYFDMLFISSPWYSLKFWNIRIYIFQQIWKIFLLFLKLFSDPTLLLGLQLQLRPLDIVLLITKALLFFVLFQPFFPYVLLEIFSGMSSVS